MREQHNGRPTVRDNTEQNTAKGLTPDRRIEIKIPNPAGNRTRAIRLEGIDSTDHATATNSLYSLLNIIRNIKSRQLRWARHVVIVVGLVIMVVVGILAVTMMMMVM